MFTKWIDRYRKSNILLYATKMGCDADGDIIRYKGVDYYVNIYHDHVERIRK